MPCRGKHGIRKFCQNTGNLGCSSCKLPDSKGERYFDICHENFQFFSCWISLPSQFCVCHCHKSRKLAQGQFAVGQGKHREFENAIRVGTLVMVLNTQACWLSIYA